MQLHNLLIIMASVLGTVQAGCYTSGESWGSAQAAAWDAAAEVCDTTVAGDFSSRQMKEACRNIGPNKFAIFQVQWGGGGNNFISDPDCTFRLRNEIGGCGQGGQSTIGNWFFRYDMNSVAEQFQIYSLTNRQLLIDLTPRLGVVNGGSRAMCVTLPPYIEFEVRISQTRFIPIPTAHRSSQPSLLYTRPYGRVIFI
jgi:hypothetical protein